MKRANLGLNAVRIATPRAPKSATNSITGWSSVVVTVGSPTTCCASGTGVSVTVDHP